MSRYNVFHPAVDGVLLALNSAVANGVKTAAATPVVDVVYEGAALNGANITGGRFNGGIPRAVSVVTGASVGTYRTGANFPILVQGRCWRTGKAIAESLLLTAANGGETISGTVLFHPDHVISISVPGQVDASGTFAFGVTVARAVSPPCHGVHVSSTTGGTGIVCRLSRQAHNAARLTLAVSDVGDQAWEIAEIHAGTTATLVALYGAPRHA
jgi:hypothetical protein